MKVFVAVVMFVLVSIAFADDVVWQVAPPFSLMPGDSGQESGKAPKDRMTDSDEEQAQAQQSQQNAGSKPTLKTEPETKRAQATDQQTDGGVYPHKIAKNAGWSPYLTLWVVGGIIAIIVGAFAIGGFFINLSQAKRSKKADTMTEQHRERTEKFAHAKERPLLSLREWELTPHEPKKTRTLEDKPDIVKCNLVNTNGTPAILGGIYEDRWVVDSLPAAPNFREKLSYRLKGTILERDYKHPMRLDPLPTTEWKAVMYGPKTLYAFIYVEYSDTSGNQYKIGTLARYIPDDRKFVVEQHPGYTCNT
jgi:hypothetical protein